MVRRLLICSLTSAGMFWAMPGMACAQVQPIALDQRQSEDQYDQMLGSSSPQAPRPLQIGRAIVAAPVNRPGAKATAPIPTSAPQVRVISGQSMAQSPPPPMIIQNIAPGESCLPGMPFTPGMAPPMPIDPGMPPSPPQSSDTPTPGPSPTPSEAAPSSPPSQSPPQPPAPIGDQFQPSPLAPQPNAMPMSSAQPLDFSQGLGSQTLLASRDIPAMVGDLFGSGQFTTVCIQPEPFIFQGPSQIIQFADGFNIRNFGAISPGGGLPTDFRGTDDGTGVLGRMRDFNTSGNAFFEIRDAGGVTLPAGSGFTSLNGNVTIPGTTGTPLVLIDVLTNPGQPTSGTFFEIDQNQAANIPPNPANEYEDAVVADVQAVQPGFQGQKNAFEAINGPGTFVDSGPGAVTLEGGYAILSTAPGPGPRGTGEEYFVQQVESYTPDPTTYTPDPVLIIPAQICFDVPGGSVMTMPGSQVGRLKLTENTSPIPRDRAYVNYSYFDNTPLFPGGVNVNRVTPGFEKTFLDGNMSVELRAPFATTLDSDILAGGITNTDTTQFGNLTAYLKGLLWDDESWALASGVGVAVPTAEDVQVTDAFTGNALVGVDNQAVHLLPFVGGAYVPNDRLFVQSILQFDIDLNGNDVSATSFDRGLPTGNLSNLGSGRDQTLMFYDISVGYWLPTYLGPITRVAPILEYHLNQTVGDGDAVSGTVGNTFYNFRAAESMSQSNGVVGLVASLRDEATLTVAYAAPLGGADEQFDGEVRVMFNWFFGGNGPLRYGPALR